MAFRSKAIALANLQAHVDLYHFFMLCREQRGIDRQTAHNMYQQRWSELKAIAESIPDPDYP